MKPIIDEQLNKTTNADVPEANGQNKSKTPFPCDKCDNKFDSADEVSTHKRGVHSSANNLICKHCSYIAKSSAEMNSHLKSHSSSSNTLYICDECDYQDLREVNVLNHRIAKHSKHSCNKCDYQTNLESQLTKHKIDVHGEKPTPTYQCDVCDFGDNKEENVLNHKIANHSKEDCEMCDFTTENNAKLEEHVRDIHKQTKFKCNVCLSSFKTKTTLQDHLKSHKPDTFPCDYCGHKADSLSKLDDHIETYHRINKSGKPSNAPDSKNKAPCDFKSPQHSSSCCDRDQGKPMKIFTPKQRLENGPCQNWNKNACGFSDLCRFAHIEL